VIRTVSFIRVLFPVAVMFGFFQLADQFLPPNIAPITGFVCFFILVICLRETISKHHRRGMRKMGRSDFEGAIGDFERSLEFFEKNAWLDTYRLIFVMSAGQMMFKEMALVNIAFAHGQCGRGEKAIETYEKVLQLYPKNVVAKTTLRMLKSTKADQADSQSEA